jgi:hypothetical protein
VTASMSTSLYCDRDTRPAVDGMRTRCGLEFGPAALTVDQLRHVARDYGWVATGTRDFCPAHKTARQEDTA